MPVADAEARRAVAEDLDRTLFLEAGAGSGKTSCLVSRFVALVESGIPADGIAAITFTEKAAGELLDRIRGELEHGAGGGSQRCADALGVLDRAAIGTLHAFAQRILNEHPVEAGLPPRIQVLDEIASQVAFEERWEAYVDQLLDDPQMDRPLRLLLASGVSLDHLHDVAAAFDDNWDLVADRAGWRPPAVPPLETEAVVAGLEEVLALADHCTDDTDKLLEHLQGPITDLVRDLAGAVDDDARLQLLQGKVSFGLGRKGNWSSVGIDVVRERLAGLKAECEVLCRGVQEGVLQVLATSLAGFTVAGAHDRQRAGELEFHDLLVLARAVLRHPEHGPAVRSALARRYRRLLLDEFQDTDPIQIELAALIGSDDPAAGTLEWSQIPVEPGRLFFVGDPKQSIYRFRRADIAMFLRARDELVASSEVLTKNFRSVKPIVAWVNHTFGQLIHEVPESQPAYLPLEAARHGAPPSPDHPAVALVGRLHPKQTKAGPLREAEAADVVAAICTAMEQRWPVGKGGGAGTEMWRNPRWSDIAVLLPARTSLPFLEQALEGAGVPYRAETSSLVYGTREVRDLLMVARAVDDPTDGLAAVAALRTPGLACGDDDLFTWRRRHEGRWDHQAPPPAGAPVDHPVARGLAWMGELHRQRLWLSPSQVLERIVADRRLMELAVAERRPRDLWRRLRFVLDQCRAWEEAGGVTLRRYLRWAEGQSAEGSRVVETVLPESDDDAVRILTVHGAKGLEFPIVVLSGLTTELRSAGRGVEVRFPPAEAWAIKLKKGVSTAEFELSQPLEEQMDIHERLRLLYVAATRARDHLIVSVHRKERTPSVPTAAEVLYGAGRDPALATLLDVGPQPPVAPAPDPVAPVAAAPELPTPEAWRASHQGALTAASRPLATSATQLAAEAAERREAEWEADRRAAGDPGLAKGAKDVDLPPWQKGRYGTAVGRAVHGVLQSIDLATGDGLDRAVAAQAAAEGVLGREGVIADLCRSALASDVVGRAAARSHWREVYVGVPYGDGVLEGYIDLLYRDEGALVVVDYKTDAWSSEADLAAKVERYSVQLQAYADAVRVATSEPVAGGCLLFLGPTATRTVHVAVSEAAGAPMPP